MTIIRLLSSPHVPTTDGEDSYETALVHNFRRIGELANSNRQLLRDYFEPILKSTEPLSNEAAQTLADFCQNVIDASYEESLDASIVTQVTDRLVQDALAKDDIDYLVERLDAQIMAYYTLVNMTMRITCAPQVSASFRNQGLGAAKRLLAFLGKDQFVQLSDTSRELVLTNARYAAVLFEAVTPTPELNPRLLAMLDKALRLYEDDFYQCNAPEFDKDYSRLRALEYYARATDVHNGRRFTQSEVRKITQRGHELKALWDADPKAGSAVVTKGELTIIEARNGYLCHALSLDQYLAALLDVYETRDPHLLTGTGAFENLLAPLEYLLASHDAPLTPARQDTLAGMYQNICEYAPGIARKNCLSFVLEYFSLILENFIEVPGGMSFEEAGIRFLAALHPPTYIHSTMVGLISQCLAQHLAVSYPELLVGALGFSTEDEVRGHAGDIADFAYHAGRCHDFGKLSMIDTVFVYGRNLFDFEFHLIQEHPTMGAKLLAPHESTSAYAEVALCHHRFYDGTRGYPAGATCDKSLKTIVDLVTCADCMDAATDPVGRAYRSNKTLDDYLDEVRQEAGTRYAPYLPKVLANPRVRADLDILLGEGRQQVYQEAHRLLQGIGM